MSAATVVSAPVSAPPVSARPLVGVGAVLLGAIISTLYGRVTSFGLADIRGAVHAGFDEGAWITTASTVGQMLMGVLSVWLGAAFGPRRVLFWGAASFAVCCLLIPLSPGLPVLLALQFIAGLGSGTFVPLTISFVMRSLQPEYRVFGIAAYAMSLELSQNVPASIEGFYVDHWGWQWIFWQQVVLAPVQLLLIRFGMPRDPINWAMLAESDLPGILYLGGGASLAYAALDQGDRLDWLGSGVIAGLAAGALLLLALFILRELTTQKPFFDLRFASRGNLPKFAAILTLYRFQVLATAFVVPQFLIVVHGFRALEVGEALVWIAIPQFLLAPAVALLLRRVEARFVMAAGFSWIGLACLMVANGLTSDWISGDFLESQLLQAAGQTFGLTAFIFFAVQHLVPAQVLTFGAFLQTFRLLGGELGTSTMTWFVRSREQVHSNLLGQHVQPGGVLTESRLHDLAGAVAARSVGSPQAVERSSSLLAGAVRTQSYVLAFVDAMTLVAMATVCCLLFVAWLRPAPVVQKA